MGVRVITPSRCIWNVWKTQMSRKDKKVRQLIFERLYDFICTVGSIGTRGAYVSGYAYLVSHAWITITSSIWYRFTSSSGLAFFVNRKLFVYDYFYDVCCSCKMLWVFNFNWNVLEIGIESICHSRRIVQMNKIKTYTPINFD